MSQLIRALTPVVRTGGGTHRLVGRGTMVVCTALLVLCPSRLFADDHLAGRWLLDYGLGHALSVDTPGRDDADYVLIWLEAAAAMTPSLPEIYLWQFDLLSRLNKTDDALDALATYCRLTPADTTARLGLLEKRFTRKESVEARRALCQKILNDKQSSPELRSDAYYRLAILDERRAELETAIKNARRATETDPYNLAAHTLLARLEDRLDKPQTRIDLFLRQFGLTPGDPVATWNVARCLAALGLSEPAIQWFDRLLSRIKEQSAPPIDPDDVRLARARAQFDLEQYEKCYAQCEKLLATDRAHFPAALLAIESARKLGQTEAARRLIDTLAAHVRAWEQAKPERQSATQAAQIAWYYLDLAAQPERALRFARQAAELTGDAAEMTRLVGMAQRAAGQTDEAVKTLTPVAESDPLAALTLARIHLERDNRDAAIRLLTSALRSEPNALVRRRIITLLDSLGQSPPPIADRDDIVRRLNEIPGDLLNWPDAADNAVEMTVVLDRHEFAFDQPVMAGITLKNTASYPLSLGEHAMVDPRVAVSIEHLTAEKLAIKRYTVVNLPHGRTLKPGQAITVRKNLSVALGRRVLNHWPQRRFQSRLTLTLLHENDAPTDAQASPRVAPVTVELTREAVDANPAGIADLTERLTSGSEQQRIRAVRTVVALIEERARSYHTDATYHAVRINPQHMRKLLTRALDDSTPWVRATALFGYLSIEIDNALISAAAPAISDKSWIVRLAATEVLAKKQGPKFSPVLQTSQQDRNKLVARLARLYLRQLDADRR